MPANRDSRIARSTTVASAVRGSSFTSYEVVEKKYYLTKAVQS